MPARRCNECAENWPQSYEFNRCPRCDAQTTYHSSYTSEYTRDEAAALKDGVLPEGDALGVKPNAARDNRVDRYLEYGFSEIEAHILADAARSHRDSSGRLWPLPLNHLDVRRALDRGCTHQLAMEVFA